MSKTFKVVCIENTGAMKLEVGGVYEGLGEAHESKISLVDSWYRMPISSKYFLRLPTEPKTCADMTMEEYLAMVCLAYGDGTVQVANLEQTTWYDKSTAGFVRKSDSGSLYRIKPEKSAKDVEIEAIEKEMRALLDRLAKVRGDKPPY